MFHFNRYDLQECTDTVWVCRVLVLGESTLVWCWFSRWSIVWCFLPQTLTRHLIWHMQSFSKWVFEKQFLHVFYLVAKSILSFIDFYLNSLQSINRCLPLQSRHAKLPLLPLSNSCSSGPFSFSFSFLSALLFMKFENIFLLKLYFGCCWCFDDSSWIAMISFNGLNKSLMSFSSQLLNYSNLVVPSVRLQSRVAF